MLSANKFALVKKELDRCKVDDSYLVSWFFPDENPAAVRDNPYRWQPTIKDAVNEIANFYGDSFEEYTAIYSALEELL